MTQRPPLSIGPGAPAPLGATAGVGGVNFAVVAAHADAVHVCLFDAADNETGRFCLPSRHGDVHCGFLVGAEAGCRYGLRAEGPWAPERGHRYDAAKLLTDPYAMRLDRPFAWHPALAHRGRDTARLVPMAIVETSAPPLAPQMPRPLGFVYELPVKAFTIGHPDVPAPLRGTVAALAQPCIVAHLQRLGVDTIELMPLTAWIDERHLPALGLANAWGYNPISLLAPDPRLAPGGCAEIRQTLATLHDADFRVVLDVVVNHTGESDAAGATVSLRGLDNALYYAHDAGGRLVNDSGCGNTLALDAAPVVKLVMDALRHWAALGFDGFRFDLATVLGRTARGFDTQSPLLTAIAQDPVLSHLVMIAEPWDATGEGYRLGAFPYPWHEWNDRYRDRVRRFWRGDAHATGELATAICGSSDVFAASRRAPSASVNFLAAHDGFTLRDVVHHAHKRNEANGEDNRDGHSGEISWVSPSAEADIRALLTTLMVSRGTPMLTAGDEFGRTQSGNNNAYAQDNATTWLDWKQADAELVDFVARLAALRRQVEPLRADVFLEGRDVQGIGFDDAGWLDSTGRPVTAEQWAAADFATFGLVLARQRRVVLWFNRLGDEVVCVLPDPQPGHDWSIAVDSADTRRNGLVDRDSLAVASHSVLVLLEVPRTSPDPARAAGKRSAGATDQEIATLAHKVGIEAEWHEVDGTHHRVTPQTQRALLAAMRVPAATSGDVRSSLRQWRERTELRAVPRNARLVQHQPGHLPIVLPATHGRPRLALTLKSEAGDEQALQFRPGDLVPIGGCTHDGIGYRRYALALPGLAPGFYRTCIDACPDVIGQLIIHPQGCHLPEALREPRRTFGLAAHLYSLRDGRDAGIGDLATLARFSELARDVGGITVGINPLHHLFPTDRARASPYQPSDRNFLDPIYLDLDGLVAELGGDTARAAMLGSADAIARLRSLRHVDYQEVWALKERVLRALYSDCGNRSLPDLDRFIADGGEPLQTHALFEALAARAGTVDRSRWPAGWRDLDVAMRQRLCREFRDEIRFRALLQWSLERQLETTRARGPALGLYRDLALGVAYDGGEVWARPGLFAETVSLGAPPDPFAAAGQVWNLPPFIPHRLQDAGYAPMAHILAANMRAAGALRIDHILGYARQFWVPRGAEGSAGAYVRFPIDDLIAVTALSSAREKCCIIGEDLGTVPAGLRAQLAAADILSYRVLLLERGHGGAFLSPASFPPLSVVCLATHDLPPFLGWTKAAGASERGLLEAAVTDAGMAVGETDADLSVAAHALAARAPSALMLIQADDMAGETQPLNVPGTDRENPNWRRRIGPSLGQLAHADVAERLLAAVTASRSGEDAP